MEIMGSERKLATAAAEPGKAQKTGKQAYKEPQNVKNAQNTAENTEKTVENEKKEPENVFSEENLKKSSEIPDTASSDQSEGKTTTLTSSDKVAFLDSVVNNSRFTRKYSLFGGKLTFTLRSLTNDEVNALSAWMLKSGSNDSTGIVSGRYRKYLVAAQVEMFNGTQMPPLEEPLFETLDADGKTTVKPGWISRSTFWDDLPVGVFTAIMNSITDFDARYSMLCAKADDSNFWLPDTP